jgi:alanine dehydrogenase
MVLLLRQDEMRGLVSLTEAVEACETGFRQWAQNPNVGELRRRVAVPSGARTLLHHGASPESRALGICVHCEAVRVDPDGRQRFSAMGSPVRVVYDSETAELRAILIGEPYPAEFPDTHSLVGMPTAAASIFGTKLLARPDSSDVAVLGSGTQAKYHLGAMNAVFPLERVRVYSPTPENREKFAAEMQQALNIDVEATDSAQRAVTDADVVLLATDTTVPVLDGDWLASGAHVTSIVWSSTYAQKRRELDDRTLQRASVVATNSLEQVNADEGADLYDTVQLGILEPSKLIDIGQLIRNEVAGRTSADQISVFKNCAFWGIADQVIADKLLHRARERGLGVEIETPAAHYP